MGYEIAFIGVKGEKKDADAICFRWIDEYEKFHIGVYDAGFQAHGTAMVELLNRWYFDYPRDRKREKKIDCLFVSHPHRDHTSGVKELFEHFKVERLYMNRPWMHAKTLERLYSVNGHYTAKSIERELRKDFSCIAEIERIAYENETDVLDAFCGESMDSFLEILSPTKELYWQKLAESSKTHRLQKMGESLMESVAKGEMIRETWKNETLSKNAETDAENETSVIVCGNVSDGKGNGFLLVGDAGVEGLTTAMDFADEMGMPLFSTIGFLEIPHHGGRHNVTPKVLDRLLGEPYPMPGMIPFHREKIACASVGDDSDHPRKVVVNAFIRRGVDVYETRGTTIIHSHDFPSEAGRQSSSRMLDKLKFSEWVEG